MKIELDNARDNPIILFELEISTVVLFILDTHLFSHMEEDESSKEWMEKAFEVERLNIE